MMQRFILTILLLALLAPLQLFAAEPPSPLGMTIRADRMEHDAAKTILRASGKVEVIWQDTTMFADEAVYDSNRKLLTAHGNIRVTKAGDTLWGDTLILDTESGRAELENGRLFMAKGNFRADGKQIIRAGEDDYSLKHGGFTTCDAEVPSWKFRASELDVTLEEYATGKHVVFYIKDIPVFYFPYLIFPAKRERQSGFLFPRLGSSQKRGQFMELPYYWAISPSQEATVTLDIQTKRGVGSELDYRYLRNRTSEGRIGGYLIHDEVTDTVRGQFSQKHYESLGEGFWFADSINLNSDKTFLYDFGDRLKDYRLQHTTGALFSTRTDTSDDYNRQYNESRAVIAKSWQQRLASIEGIYTQSNREDIRTSSTLQTAPKLTAYTVREPLPGVPFLYFDLDLAATNFYREQGIYGLRLSAEPRVSAVQALWNGRLNLTLFGAAELRAYSPEGDSLGIVEDRFVALPQAGAQLSSSLSRIYELSLLDLTRLRHEVVPTFSYRYARERDQSSLPFFDLTDRTSAQDQFDFSVASHLGGRIARDENAAYRDLLILRLTQSYHLSHRHQTDPVSLITQDGAWGDLLLESEFWPHRYAKLLSDIRYRHSDGDLISSATGAELNDQRGNSARISYRSIRHDLEYLEATASLALSKPFYLSYNTRYSFDTRDFLESHYTVEYRHQCWSAIVGYRERNGDKSWTINFNLAGLFESKNRPSAR